MTLWQSLLLGLVQGLTEFLPVSSSGHLAILKNLLGLKLETGLLFDVVLHLGTLLAVFIAFFRDIRKLIVEGCGIVADLVRNLIIFFKKIGGANRSYIRIVRTNYRKFVILVIVATIPTGVIGYVARDRVEIVGAGLLVPGICLMITGVLLLIADATGGGRKVPKDVSYTNGFLIGICQGIAVLPGISRSGTTISACLLSGFDRKFAVKFSFIMSIPAVLGAAVLELKDLDKTMFQSQDIINYAVGALVAAVVGYICIKTMLVVVRNKKFKYFSIYCFAVGLLAVIGARFIV